MVNAGGYDLAVGEMDKRIISHFTERTGKFLIRSIRRFHFVLALHFATHFATLWKIQFPAGNSDFPKLRPMTPLSFYGNSQ
jgi:hypothetical protein